MAKKLELTEEMRERVNLYKKLQEGDLLLEDIRIIHGELNL